MQRTAAFSAARSASPACDPPALRAVRSPPRPLLCAPGGVRATRRRARVTQQFRCDVRAEAAGGAALGSAAPRSATAAAGFGSRGAAVVDALLAGGTLPPQACVALAASDSVTTAAAALAGRGPGGCVLVGGAVEACTAATVELARRLTAEAVPVCAVLASPFAFEGARKAAAAADVAAQLRDVAELVVVVDQERLMSDAASGMTLAQATQAADSVLCGATRCICHLLECDSHIVRRPDGSTEVVQGLFVQELRRLGPLSAPAAFGTSRALLSAADSDTAAAAAITAAAFSAASTPFLSHVRTSPCLACVCLVRAAAPLPAAVLEAATQALATLLTGCPLMLCFVADAGAAGALHVDLFVVSDAGGTESAATQQAAPARDADAQSQRTWAAMAGLAGGARTARAPRPAPTAAPPPAPVQATRVKVQPQAPPLTARSAAAAAPPPPPTTAAARAAVAPQPPVQQPLRRAPDERRTLASGGAAEQAGPLLPKGSRSSKRSVWSLFGGAQKETTPSVSARASAVLASDRAASRVVVRLSYPDGSSYEGEMQDGTPHGIGRRVYSNGSWYAGEWQHGVRHGWGVSQTGADRYEGLWTNGVPGSGDAVV